MQPIASLEELAAELDRIEVLPVDGERRAAWGAISFTPEFVESFAGRYRGVDPASDAYRAIVMEHHARISGKAYSESSEGFDIDLRHELLSGFPYGSQSSFLIGSFLIAYGHLIKLMNLPAKARVLEMGCGLGSLSVHLARSNYQLTCLDVNRRFLDLVAALTATAPHPVKVSRQNMETFHFDEKFDAILFFESFHHCIRHRELLMHMKNYLADDGIVVLAAEPVVPHQIPVIPYPWGLRLDGETLRAVRQWGWMELGFTEEYLYRLLADCGYSVSAHRLEASQWSHVIIAKPIRGNA